MGTMPPVNDTTSVTPGEQVRDEAGRQRQERAHEARTRAIASAVARIAADRQPVYIDKGGVHHVVPLPGDARFSGKRIDVSSLNHILWIDPEARLCAAEPGVTFATLVERTLMHGLVPTLVPELEGITLGGAVAGCSVESMSHRYGGFHDGVIEYEVVTGRGEVRQLTPESHPLPFHMLHGSYGTLATLTKLVFKLVPAKRFVALDYVTYRNAASYLAAMRQASSDGVELIDGIVHDRYTFILCLGRFVDDVPRVSNYRGEHMYWSSTRRLEKDYLTTRDYFFRYDTECHWLTRTVPPLTWPLVRRHFGRWFLGSTNLITWSARLERILALKKRPDVVVDVFIPARELLAFLEWYARDFDFWPLWVVPYRPPGRYPWLTPAHWERMGDDLIIDCAVYGKQNDEPDVDWSQVLEEATFRHHGIKTLISRNHYDRERFWQIYDHDAWQRAKDELDPDGLFPELYEKVHRV
jgi:FAD/FMN-containing dehydrogenase